MDEGVQILELARNAQKLFERQQPREKRRLLNFVLSNCSWEDGEVIATFRQPFDLLAQTTAIATRAATSQTPIRQNLRFGCPSWIHIELCAVPQSQPSGRFWRIFGICASLRELCDSYRRSRAR